jgi:hypothetical protein
MRKNAKECEDSENQAGGPVLGFLRFEALKEGFRYRLEALKAHFRGLLGIIGTNSEFLRRARILKKPRKRSVKIKSLKKRSMRL